MPVHVNLDATDLVLTPLPSEFSDITQMPKLVNRYTSSRMPVEVYGSQSMEMEVFWHGQ